ncbi:hypothetical protein LTR95_017860, partial [Oleoguttula sp. CCFEE 5521]
MSSPSALQQLGFRLDVTGTLRNASDVALSCDIDTSLLRNSDVKAALTSTRRVTLKLSHHIRSWTEEEDDGTGPKPEDHSNDLDEQIAAGDLRARAVVDLFNFMPDVEEVDLHWYSLRQQTQSAADIRERDCINDVLETVPFKSLQKLTLRGAYIDGLILKTLLERSPIKHIHLEH